MAKKRQQLITCREAKGSRDSVCSELGISKVYLRMIENGTMKPGRDLMIRFSTYYDRPLEVLFPDLFGDSRDV
ncbi:helix-turn-helix transcriptional regulator [Paenibacillus sp. J31TS4]|uniref:helix-turn-helix transcriptional regulator n=1 Tax=Paenibacillus sp. J31TS4 TaxID=2807195 RepID=UPI001BD0D809|nr:helix-turn-helix transcriptional regulator [Paenibacillus sp. J31TS4]